MSYTIKTGKPFLTEVQRAADSQIRKGLEHLRQGDDLEEIIHDIRKRCKKVRAAWRLLRHVLGDVEYKKRNKYYRDTARLLSELRDASAILEALDKLEKKYPDAKYQPSFAEARKILIARRDAYLPKASTQAAVLEKVTARLEKGLEVINPILKTSKGWSATVKSLALTYGRGYDLCREALQESDPDTIHQWRKRTKYLRYQIRLLREVWPALFKPWHNELKRLSDWQGDHHDLHVFKQIIFEQKDLSSTARKTLKDLARRYQKDCYEKVLPLGRRLFAEETQHFTRRMQIYLETW